MSAGVGGSATARRRRSVHFVPGGNEKMMAVINAAFAPSREAVDEARELVARFDEHARRGVYAFTFKGQMVDAPHLALARRVLARAGE